MTPTGIWSQVCSLSEPGPGMIVGSDGNFYGALIRVTPSCKVTRPSFQIEYGDSVSSPPILASDGNIYFGGVFRPNGFGVYRMNFSTKQVEFVYSTPDTFPVQLLQASDGNLWGLANYGETSTFFSITLGGDHFQLGSFDCKTTGCEPTGMVEGTDGNFYGIASYGGDPKSSGGDGGVFKIAAGLRQ
jgi:hypothetical protein